jgi:hypothetical protein
LVTAFHQLLGKQKVVLCSEAEKQVELSTDRPITDAREEARRAARRLVAFGWPTPLTETRPVEPVQNGKVVETSFAKGEWGIRWKD